MIPNLFRAKRMQLSEQANIAQLLVQNANKYPNKEFLVFNDRSYSFKRVNQETNRMARWLQSEGVKPKEIVCMMMENSIEFIITWFAINKIGATAAFINYNLKNQALTHCLSISTSTLLIFHDTFSEAVATVSPTLSSERPAWKFFAYRSGFEEKQTTDFNVVDEKYMSQFDDTEFVIPKTKVDDAALLIYTSGTTGMPKAAIMTHIRFFNRIYSCLPLYHSSAAVIGIGTTLQTSSTLCLSRKFSASSFWTDCVRYRATVFQYIGELCRYLLNAYPPTTPIPAHSVRLAIGNGLRPDIWMEFKDRFGVQEVGEFYASSEGECFIAKFKIVKLDLESEEPIRRKNGFCIECKPDEPGELLAPIIAGDLSKDFKGYHNNSKATHKKVLRDVFAKGDAYFRSGDLLRRDRIGYFYFVD
ncbi:hypothetical protein HK102_003496, partial [Quaeritorhiza haematococci]